MVIDSGVVQQLPSWWPPIHTVAPATLTNNGIAITYVKALDGALTVSLDAAGLVATFNSQQVLQDSNINALTATVALLQTNLSNLQTDHAALLSAHNTLLARVDAAGIP
jgi:hypothetical protein